MHAHARRPRPRPQPSLRAPSRPSPPSTGLPAPPQRQHQLQSRRTRSAPQRLYRRLCRRAPVPVSTPACALVPWAADPAVAGGGGDGSEFGEGPRAPPYDAMYGHMDMRDEAAGGGGGGGGDDERQH
eukprot:TRINITY_DN1351_c0_g1_i1.p3 TRINITY_DN1351_c0_g1~~TRINITY_DN1351_c0_g1_i1.p3  ORF type:complete len:127 (-),score=13.92 TRINITY_DN1351_c0_g1_i1:106-486(-)